MSMSKRELLKLKPADTPIALEGDDARGLAPATYHPIHGMLQEAPAISLKNQTVLQEDAYMEALASIIKRDYFPSLDLFEKQKQKKKNNNLKSLSANQNLLPSPSASSFLCESPAAAEQSHHHSKRWEDGAETPKIVHQAETPGRTPLRATPSLETPTPSHAPDVECHQPTPPKPYHESLSLDQFCSQYTSEDNSSFSEILNNANRLKRIKYAWAFDSSSKHNSRLLESTLKREHLIQMIGKMSEGGHGVGLIEGISGKPGERKMVENVVTAEERLAIQAGQEPKLITGNTHNVKPDDSYPQNLKPGKSVTAIDVTTDRHQQPIKNPDAWPHVTRNALMFAPDANTSSHQPAKPPPFPAKPPVLPGDPKSINHASTRMVNDDFLEESLKRSRAPSSRHSLSSLSPSRSQIAAVMNGGNASNLGTGSPKVNGFSFVAELPTPDPERMKETKELDELMTWGEIMGTPVRLDGGDGASQMAEEEGEEEEEEEVEAGPFRISKRARREELAIGMARQASKSLREKYGQHGAAGLAIAAPGGRPHSHHPLRRMSRLAPASPSRSPALRQRGSTPLVACASPRREEILSPAAKLLLHKTGKFSDRSSAPKRSASSSSLHSPASQSALNSSPQLAKKPGIFTPIASRPSAHS
ncbi:hypothetical protein PCANC_11691 [Puccinia coronata f. sp. avenae]|uniref:Protein DGCR14 n=1 Tax=Puccinia coronata f. sp. avenae TaxID=200324 RepID=A0A2N5VXL4_9BASI|nr:hypothetical protein PCANC_11691 [Puccinia coronata f. sp. avenae]